VLVGFSADVTWKLTLVIWLRFSLEFPVVHCSAELLNCLKGWNQPTSRWHSRRRAGWIRLFVNLTGRAAELTPVSIVKTVGVTGVQTANDTPQEERSVAKSCSRHIELITLVNLGAHFLLTKPRRHPPGCLHGLLLGLFLLSYSRILFLVFFLIFSFLCRALDQAGHLVSVSAHDNLPYRIVSPLPYVTYWAPSTTATMSKQDC